MQQPKLRHRKAMGARQRRGVVRVVNDRKRQGGDSPGRFQAHSRVRQAVSEATSQLVRHCISAPLCQRVCQKRTTSGRSATRIRSWRVQCWRSDMPDAPVPCAPLHAQTWCLPCPWPLLPRRRTHRAGASCLAVPGPRGRRTDAVGGVLLIPRSDAITCQKRYRWRDESPALL